MPEEMTREERKKRLEERRQKRRKRLERSLSAQIAGTILAIGLILSILLLVIPRPKESQLEKRPLATIPQFTVSGFTSGEFTHGITTAYDDTIPFRDSLKNLNNSMKTLFGLRTENTVEIIGKVTKVEDQTAPQPEDNDAAGPDQTGTPDTPAGDNATQAAPGENTGAGTDDQTGAAEGTDTAAAGDAGTTAAEKKDYEKEAAEGDFSEGFLIINQDGHWRGLPLFAGGDGSDYASFLNSLRAQIDPSINVYAMPIPLASAYYLPENFSDYSVDQRKTFEGIFAMLNDGVTPINLIDVLGSHENEDIFLRTDHHWTALGAYYGCQALANAAGVPFIDLADYHEIQRPGYVGSMYGYTQSANLLNDPEVFSIYIPATPYVTAYHNPDYTYAYQDDLFIRTDTANSYLAFHAGDAMIIHTITGTKNGRKLLILKDSYGDPMSGLLTGSFEEIFSVDLRYCTVNLLELIYDQGITDIAAAMDIDTVAYPTADLDMLLTQSAGFGVPHDEPEDMVVPAGPGSPYYADAVNGNDPLLVE